MWSGRGAKGYLSISEVNEVGVASDPLTHPSMHFRLPLVAKRPGRRGEGDEKLVDGRGVCLRLVVVYDGLGGMGQMSAGGQ